MAFSMILGGAGFTPDKIDTSATITLERKDGGFAITASHLDVTAVIPGIDDATFQDLAGKAKAGCPVSKLLNATITMEAKLA
jgi:osmotically inducible protein OsmC